MKTKVSKISPTTTQHVAPFAMAVRQRHTKDEPAASSAKPAKRENTFSQSRDTREDRAARQMKTSHSSQTLSHGR